MTKRSRAAVLREPAAFDPKLVAHNDDAEPFETRVVEATLSLRARVAPQPLAAVKSRATAR